MRRLSLAVLFGIGAIGFAADLTRADTTIYDSGGFDTVTRFSPTFVSASEPLVLGNLRGQDSGAWFYAGGNTSSSTLASAQVITTAEGPTNSPQQSVQVTRNSGDGAWAPVFSYNATGSTVKVTWSMDLAALTGSNTNFGPFFGIDGFTSGNTRLGGAGIDASTGEFLYEDTPTSFNVINFNPGTGFGTVIGTGWHAWEIDYDFTSHTYSVKVGTTSPTTTEVSGVSFLTPGASVFASANITTLQDDAANPNPTGTAYFDDYLITAVPEPTSMAAMLLGLVGCGLRVRRR